MSIILQIIKEVIVTLGVLICIGLLAYGAGVLTQGRL
jgi:hypothetical protein